MSQQLIEFAPDTSTAGFRLHHASIYNWGTFHGQVHRITPDGRTSLLSGGNGSGKSTFADAILTLLVPNQRRNYNVASNQGGRKERSEKDYVLGAYSERHDEEIGRGRTLYLRKPGETYSVLLAHFYNETFNSHATVAQVLWVNTAGRVEKAFVAEPKELTIEGDFNHLGSPSEIRQALRERGFTPHDSFTAYSLRFHQLLFMPTGKSPMEIFNQAICIKDISNLTQFIRDYMLDDGGSHDRLESLRKNFEELRITNERIETARRQLDHLNAIHADHQIALGYQNELKQAVAHERALPLYFAEIEDRLRLRRAEQLATDTAFQQAEQIRLETEIDRLTDQIHSLRDAITQSAEGRRLEEIASHIKTLEPRLEDTQKRRQRFDEKLAHWNPGLTLESGEGFVHLLKHLPAQASALEQDKTRLRQKLAQGENQLRDLQSGEAQVRTEISHLLDSQSNIPARNAAARRFITEGLNLEESDLPFVGELIQVRPEEAPWTGALERLTRSFALCLLVPAKLRASVDLFVHRHRQRGLVVYHCLPDQPRPPNPRLEAQSAAAKLDIRQDPPHFALWLESEISHRFSHLCCHEPDHLFHHAESALTLNGLIKNRGSERRKDDSHELSDRSHYVLGWDNRTKISALEKDLATRQQAIRQLQSELDGFRQKIAALDQRLRAAAALPEIASDFAEIDWPTLAAQVAALHLEQEALKSGSDQLTQLEENKKDYQTKRAAHNRQREAVIGRLAVLAQEAASNDTVRRECSQILAAAAALTSEQPEADPRQHFDALKCLLDLPVGSLPDLASARETARHQLGGRKAKVNAKVHESSQAIRLAMEKFRDAPENQPLRDRLAVDLRVPGYSQELFQPFGELRLHILEEDLPKNQKRFEALLHNTIVEEVTNFDAMLENHADRIQKRIRELNQQLSQIDFDRREKTFIQLVPTRNSDEGIRKFRDIRRYALEGTLNIEDSREELKERYRRIAFFLQELEKDPRWTDRVIDVRNWFDFRADESWRETGQLRQSYSGSSGKSGGEKNRLASTILATAIAYQYGISIDNRQSETFRLVVVDEMFSKTDDEFSTYLLELFKEFHLQLIIVQPLDSKIHIVQKYVERYHIVTRPNGVSNVRNMSVAEYQRAITPEQE